MTYLRRCLIGPLLLICVGGGAAGSNVEGVIVYKKPFSEVSGIKGVTVVVARVEDGQSLAGSSINSGALNQSFERTRTSRVAGLCC